MIICTQLVGDGLVTIELVESGTRFSSVLATNTSSVPVRVRVWASATKQYEEIIPAQGTAERNLPANPRIADYIGGLIPTLFHAEAA